MGRVINSIGSPSCSELPAPMRTVHWLTAARSWRLWNVMGQRADLSLAALAMTFPAALYRIIDPADSRMPALPSGCDWLQSAIDAGRSVLIEYHGGSKGGLCAKISRAGSKRAGGARRRARSLSPRRH